MQNINKFKNPAFQGQAYFMQCRYAAIYREDRGEESEHWLHHTNEREEEIDSLRGSTYKRSPKFISTHFGDIWPGVTSRNAQGAEPPLLKLLIILEGLAPLKICALALLFKVY